MIRPPAAVPCRSPRGIVLAVAALALSTACGIKGPPLPPVIRVADPTRDLTVVQEDRRAVLTWSYPSSTTSGESLHDLESVELWRATMNVAEAPPKAENVRDRDLNRQLLISTGELIAVLDGAGLDAATRGSKLEWSDDLVAWSRDHPSDQPQMIWYAVRSVCCGGRESGLSNIVRLVPETPPPPPTDLVLEAEADGIRLTWVPHDESPIIVERSPDGTDWRSITGAKPLTTGEWLDLGAEQDHAWNYRLRSVHQQKGGQRIIGEPGPAVGIYYPDVYPPAAPEDLVCLPEGARVRLRWRAAAEADTYRVYRETDGRASTVLATDIRSSKYDDDAPPPGTSRYRVTAVDSDGNESPASTCTAARGAPE
jgi:predicted small lipoprotein YifL